MDRMIDKYVWKGGTLRNTGKEQRKLENQCDQDKIS